MLLQFRSNLETLRTVCR